MKWSEKREKGELEVKVCCIMRKTNGVNYTLFYRQLDFSSEPGIAKEILENEPKSCLVL